MSTFRYHSENDATLPRLRKRRAANPEPFSTQITADASSNFNTNDSIESYTAESNDIRNNRFSWATCKKLKIYFSIFIFIVSSILYWYEQEMLFYLINALYVTVTFANDPNCMNYFQEKIKNQSWIYNLILKLLLFFSGLAWLLYTYMDAINKPDGNSNKISLAVHQS